jgi:hypothetical protein
LRCRTEDFVCRPVHWRIDATNSFSAGGDPSDVHTPEDPPTCVRVPELRQSHLNGDRFVIQLGIAVSFTDRRLRRI